MNGIVANLTRPASRRLTRAGLVLTCSFLSVCLVGAVHTKPFVVSRPPAMIATAGVAPNPEVAPSPIVFEQDDAAPELASGELLHDAPMNEPADPKPFAASVATSVLKSLVPPPVVPASPQFTVRMMEVTAYCACKKCCGPRAQGITASGRPVTYNGGRFVAADKAFSFNTKLRIPGYGDGQAVPVLDRGGAIKGNKLDVYFPTHAEARQWGRRFIPVTVLN
jgi:3D (Asp-Asp-Asp) domain-containing protein